MHEKLSLSLTLSHSLSLSLSLSLSRRSSHCGYCAGLQSKDSAPYWQDRDDSDHVAGELAGRARMVLLLTDGEATEGETRAHSIAAFARQRVSQSRFPVSVHSLAFGTSADMNLLRLVSAGSGASLAVCAGPIPVCVCVCVFVCLCVRAREKVFVHVRVRVCCGHTEAAHSGYQRLRARDAPAAFSASVRAHLARATLCQ